MMRLSRAFVNKIVFKARICFEFDFNNVCEKKGTNEKKRCRFSKNFLQKIDLIASGFDRNNPRAWELKILPNNNLWWSHVGWRGPSANFEAFLFPRQIDSNGQGFIFCTASCGIEAEFS